MQLTHIRLEYFGPNLTAHIQPCDASIIRTFKAIYRRLFVLCVIDTLVIDHIDMSTIFDIDQLTAMRLAKQAWISIKESTIINCWRFTKILLHANDSILEEVPNEEEEEEEIVTLQHTLNVLQQQLQTCTLLLAQEFMAQEDRVLHLAHVELVEILREYFNVNTGTTTIDVIIDVRDHLVRNRRQSKITDFFK